METMEERIEYVVRFVWQSCGVDIREYLKKIFTLDMITLNEDRHLNNLAVLSQGNQFVPAPIFDNGVSLLTANQSVNWHFPIMRWLEGEEESREKDVLVYQLQRYPFLAR